MGESHIASPRTRSVLSLPGGGTPLRSGHWYAAARRPCLRGETKPRWHAQFAPTLAWLNALALERQVARSLTTHTQASGNLCNLFQEHLPEYMYLYVLQTPQFHFGLSHRLSYCCSRCAAASLLRCSASLGTPRGLTLSPPAAPPCHKPFAPWYSLAL
jgi:hypothetical protein